MKKPKSSKFKDKLSKELGEFRNKIDSMNLNRITNLQVPNDYANTMERLSNQSPHFHEVLESIAKLHLIKNQDYSQADQGNPFSNFEESAEYAGVTVKEAFNVLIGTKIARLRNLKRKGGPPANESVDDSERDLVTYILLSKAYELKSKGI